MTMIKKPTEPTLFSDSAGQYLQKIWSEYQNSF
jgi:hypothetical protein